MMSFDCPICGKRIENLTIHQGQTVCPFCLQLITIPSMQPQPAFAEVVAEPVAEKPGQSAETLLEAEVVSPAVPAPQVAVAPPAQDAVELLESADLVEKEHADERHDDWEDDNHSTVNWRDVRDAEERARRRKARKAFLFWFTLIINLSALVAFPIVGYYMWDYFRPASYVCISGGSCTLFFLIVQFWPRKKRRAARIAD